ncbi:hypothetical protein B0O99DRAFT_615177 [Bisporella sp. PMI_857]|nr:hypothetical protein B0O99DRAFT_615177 [Bisporella sp. PMI_857]
MAKTLLWQLLISVLLQYQVAATGGIALLETYTGTGCKGGSRYTVINYVDNYNTPITPANGLFKSVKLIWIPQDFSDYAVSLYRHTGTTSAGDISIVPTASRRWQCYTHTEGSWAHMIVNYSGLDRIRDDTANISSVGMVKRAQPIEGILDVGGRYLVGVPRFNRPGNRPTRITAEALAKLTTWYIGKTGFSTTGKLQVGNLVLDSGVGLGTSIKNTILALASFYMAEEYSANYLATSARTQIWYQYVMGDDSSWAAVLDIEAYQV